MEKQSLYDYLIVGAGLFGAVFAHEAHKAGKKCLVIDKRPHQGGNIYCENIDSIAVHKYGAHIFHTDNRILWEYVNNLTEFNRFTNSPLAKYRDRLYNLPFNMNTFYQLWGVQTPDEARSRLQEQQAKYAHIEAPANLEEQALKLCGEDIYYAFIKEYTEKQWGRKATDLPAFIIKRLPFRFTFDNNYFNDAYQGIPKGGYNHLINALLANIEIKLNTDYFDNRKYFDSLAHHTLFTGCIDAYFNYEFGKLEYRSLKFEHETLMTPDFQGNAVVNYNEKKIPYTRIIEHKHFDYGTQATTVITREYPMEYKPGDEPYYPINDTKNTNVFKQYQEKSKQLPDLLLGGRLAQYSYFDMDDTIEAALKLVNSILI